jgi:hypothetical protein
MSKIGMEDKILKSQMRTTEKNNRVLVNMRFAFNGEAIANALSIDMATIVSIDACAIVFSNHGISLHKKYPKYHTSLENRSMTALGMHTIITNKSAILKFTRQ